MKKTAAPIVLSVSLAVVAGLVLGPTAAEADRVHGRSIHGGSIAGRHAGGGGSFARHSFARHRLARRPFHRPAFFDAASPVVVYAPPPVVYGPPAYDEAPAVSAPLPAYSPAVSGTVSLAPAPPRTPSVIEYPTGRYELRGDGITTPYTWVWVPNPPPPPAPEASPPAAPPSAIAPPTARSSQLYRWTDEEGVTHWTNREDTVPEPHRARTKRPEPPP